MIALDEIRQHALRLLIDAGPSGLPLANVGIGTGVYLALHGLAQIGEGPDQRIHALPRARAFIQRTAWA